MVDEWTDFYESGETIETDHKWDVQGTYEIRVKAKDENGHMSTWSEPIEVTMPKNKIIIRSILPPIFEKILKCLQIFIKL